MKREMEREEILLDGRHIIISEKGVITIRHPCWENDGDDPRRFSPLPPPGEDQPGVVEDETMTFLKK